MSRNTWGACGARGVRAGRTRWGRRSCPRRCSAFAVPACVESRAHVPPGVRSDPLSPASPSSSLSTTFSDSTRTMQETSVGTRHPAAGSGRVRAQAGTVGDAERAVCAWRAALHSAIRSLCHVTGTACRGQLRGSRAASSCFAASQGRRELGLIPQGHPRAVT